MAVEKKSSNGSDEFPVGMRVLAVDDDPACLKVLEARLRKCKYHVTTTNQAVLALQMLRENKDKFDLVISDVCMPDMDGFKLLELVGLEMDLPVIMLSAYGDTQHVTKGICHGACDYLLKPVRDEELKLIWQHVVRRKIDKNRRDDVGDGFSDQNGKLTKKRKDSSAPKKPRVSWTRELHGKFVAAVHHLGVDKAFPTSILKMMNDEKLTKDNVASHLQKYRSYLKRISREASMVISPNRLSDSAYLQMGSSVHVPTFVGFEKKSLGSFPPNNLLGRSNSPAGNGMGTFGISSLPMIQESYGQQSINPMNPSVGDKSIISPISSVFLGERRDCGTSNYSFLDTQNTPANSMLPLQSPQMESSCYVLNDFFSPTSSNLGPHDDLESLAGFENGSSFIGQLSGVGPSSIMQYNEDHMAQMMPPDSYVGSLEDIVNAIMKEQKGKGKVIPKEGHSRCNAFCHSIGNCIYT